eukprot:scaffold2708_cov119-Cylindrotheca_fusiformis.AAC.5
MVPSTCNTQPKGPIQMRRSTAASLSMSPSNMLSAKTALTPTTQDSSTPTSSTSLYSSTQRSDHSVRLPLPSPSRSRIDRQYAKRLSFGRPTSATPSHNGGKLVPPPGITRDTNPSIFRPVPIVTPTTNMDTTMSLSPLDQSPKKHFFSRDSSFGSSQGSAGSTPSRIGTYGRTLSDLGTSDRFIPSRATSKTSLNLWDSMGDRSSPRNDPSQVVDPSNEHQSSNSTDTSNTANNGGNQRQTEANQSSQSNLHNVLLRAELLGENISPYSGTAGNIAQMSGNSQPLRDGMNRLRFQSPRQAFQENIFNESMGPTSVVNSFSLTHAGSAGSLRLMTAPQKRRRRIAKIPFKVLDAPALQDDFYLNLVDWSSQNVLAVGLASCVYLWSACTSKVTKLCDLASNEDLVTSVSWAQRGTHLAVGTNRGEVQLWDSIKCKKVRTLAGHSARVGALAWTGPTLASGSRDRLIYLRDVRVQASYFDKLAVHKQEVCGLKWSFDEPSFLASGGNDNQLHVVDSRNSNLPVQRFSDHTAAVKAIAWSPHQHGLLASGGGTADRCIRFWNTLSGSSLNCVDTGSQVCNLAWSQNCNEIVSTHGYSLNQIVVWRYPSLSKVVTLTGHTYRVLYLAMSPDGSTIVTGAGDETLRFWQIFPGPRSDGKANAGGLLFPNTLGSVIR